MVAQDQPETRDELAEREEYTSRHHDLSRVVDLLAEGDDLRVTRTSGAPTFATGTVVGVKEGNVIVDDGDNQWAIATEGGDVEPEFRITGGPRIVRAASEGQGVALRAFAVERKA